MISLCAVALVLWSSNLVTSLPFTSRNPNTVLERAAGLNFLMECEGPLPSGPYPEALEMTASNLNPDGSIASLEFTGNFEDTEYIISLEDLCDDAGFYCDDGGAVKSGNVNYRFYVPELAQAYGDLCTRSCHCPAVGEAALNKLNVPSLNLNILAADVRHPNRVNRNNPDGAALGHGACLKGEATGWTFEQLAPTACCKDTKFQALTPQEAYAKYMVTPSAADILTGAVTIGVCLAVHGSSQINF